MHVLYYLPGVTRDVTPAALAEHGLGHVYAERGDYTPCAVQRGPGEQAAGVVLSDGRAERVGYYPDEQHWLRMPGGRAWVGRWTAERPTPDELARTVQLPGHLVELGDKQRWLVPTVIAAPEHVAELVPRLTLPREITLDDDGNYVGGAVAQQWQALHRTAQWWFDLTMAAVAKLAEGDAGGEFGQIDLNELLTHATTALAANYKLGKAEIVLLGLLDSHWAQEVLGAVIDAKAYWECLRKKAGSAGASSSAGPADDTPDIDQP